MNTLAKRIAIPANTSTLLLRKPIAELLQGQKREDVVVSMELTTNAGQAYQANTFFCLQKDLKLQHAHIDISVEPAKEGCNITFRADRFVRALAISLDDQSDYCLDDNHFDLLPGVSKTCFLRTTLPAKEIQNKLLFTSLKDVTYQ